jgi:hypothetical protein
MIIHETPYLKLEIDTELQCLIQHWRGFCTSEQFRAGIMKSIEVMTENHLSNILTDTRDQDLIRKEDTDWLSQEMLPIFLSSGLKAQAFILPQDLFTKVSVQNYQEVTDNVPVKIAYFNNTEDSIAWLETIAGYN